MHNIMLAPLTSEIDFSVESVTTVIITPELAEHYLLANVNKRNLSNKSFQRLVTDLRGGNFRFTADPIKFGVDGTLLDGQARLYAIVKTGIPMKVVLATGIAVDARYGIDTGASFSLKDSLELDGVTHAGTVAAALMAIQAWERGDHTKEPLAGVTTNFTSLAFLERHSEVKEVAREAAKLATKVRGLSTKQFAAYIWAFDKLSYEDRVDFFKKLVSGAGLDEGHPILLLRAVLERNEQAQEKVSNRTLNAVTIKAWNAYRSGRKMKALSFRAGGSKPEEFPLPR